LAVEKFVENIAVIEGLPVEMGSESVKNDDQNSPGQPE
jgi:hypothetical protein